jgi:hypothetical protein
MKRDEVILTFSQYATLNDEFVSAVETGKGKASGRPYAELRAEVERFGEGPFEEALASAKILACSRVDDGLVQQLISTILRTINSASETPDLTLGHIFVCQPDSVQRAFKKLDMQTQMNFYERLSNAVLNAIGDDGVPVEKSRTLRLKLDHLAPKAQSHK